jgi:hypothetical protein
MRRLSAAIVVSVTSHAVALTWLVWSGNVLAVPHAAAPPIAPAETTSVAASESESIALVLWSTARDLAERKRGLFELWDDCAETGSDELVAGGTAARAIVIGAIRARLRGADAYTASELAQLNAIRRSKAVFAPYE